MLLNNSRAVGIFNELIVGKYLIVLGMQWNSGFKEVLPGDFPDGPVAKTVLPLQGALRFDPWSGKLCMSKKKNNSYGFGAP